MSKIFVTHSYFLRFDQKQWKQKQAYPPLGTLMACSVLRDAGHEIFFSDNMFASGPEEIKSALEEFQPEVFLIYDDGFNYLTKMCLTNMREAAFEMCRMAKAKGCKVIVASSDSTDHYELYLDNGADVIIAGEGEETLKQLLNEWDGKSSLPIVNGIIYRHNNINSKTSARPVIKNPDELPFAAWDLLNIEPYREAWIESKGFFSLNINTTRGCPYQCNWCAKPIYGNRYTVRSPEKVVAELKIMHNMFAYDHIWFCDDIFGLKPGWVKRFCEVMKAENITLKFKIQSRVDLLLRENQIEDLAASGCDEVWVGAESGSQKILDAMDKGITVAQIQQASSLLKQHNVKPCFFIQFGYRGETLSDIKATLNMVMNLLPHDIGVSVSYPLPGTKFYDLVKEDMREKSNWSDSDELLLMFKNTYPAPFYKYLQRYLHRCFRSAQSIIYFKQLIKGTRKISFITLRNIFSIGIHRPAAALAKFHMRQFEPRL